MQMFGAIDWTSIQMMQHLLFNAQTIGCTFLIIRQRTADYASIFENFTNPENIN